MGRIEEYYRVYTGLHGSGICIVCGRDFSCRFNNGRAKYCSEECRSKMAKIRAMEKAKNSGHHSIYVRFAAIQLNS
jgi:hypothetical protein